MVSFHNSQLSLICCRILSSTLIRRHLLDSNWFIEQDEHEFRQQLYLSNQSWQARLPDHVFNFGFKAASEYGIKDGHLAVGAIRMLAERYLKLERGHVQVHLGLFGEWQQSVLSRISGVPIIAATTAMHLQRGGYLAGDAVMSGPCITPYDGAVEDYITREGLHESHLHLNGSSFAEECWLRAMARPDKEIKKFSHLWQYAQHSSAGDRVQELARLQDADFNPTQFRHDLMLARQLRSWLVHFVQQSPQNNVSWPSKADDLRGWSKKAPAPPLPAQFNPSNSQPSYALAGELLWMTELLGRATLPLHIDRMLLLYLLLQHQYRSLMVQSEELYGFDQFQKLTLTELRDSAEKSYVQRLRDMHGPYKKRSYSNYLEGRFAPKSTSADNIKLLKNILLDYFDYLQELNSNKVLVNRASLSSILEGLDSLCMNMDVRWPYRQQLALVAHFIKEEWNPKSSGPYRHYSLRRKLEKQMAQLRQTMKDYPRLHRWVRGVDGAANELHAPPEVFASVFRQAVRAGISHRSFHVGEDFPHLLTGIRHMLDALEILDLRDGARIGHGTALGIAPELWLERIPTTLHLPKSERLLDLLSARKLLNGIPGLISKIYQIELEITRLLQDVFGFQVSINLFERAMSMRGLHIGFVASLYKTPSWRWQDASLIDSLREEAKLVHDAKNRDEEAFSLLWEWHSSRELWGRSESLVQVNAQDDIFTSTIYLRLQQALMRQVASRRVVIETLPSSNVRISQYEKFEEHHVFRWMGIAGHIKEGDVEVMVSLGSDDPGIFAGNLRGEFYHLYAVLRNKGLSDKKSLSYVSEINERGRQYRFHDINL